MALLQTKFLVDYSEQQKSFEDFLRNFKSSSTEAEDALEDLNLNADNASDEYDFMDDAGKGGSQKRRTKHKYMDLLQNVADRKTNQVLISLDDVQEYEKTLPEDSQQQLVASIEKNAHHYIEILSRAVDNVLPRPAQETSFKEDVLDIIMTQRAKYNETILQQLEASGNEQAAAESVFPRALTRRYTLNFKPITPSGSSSEVSKKALAVRNVRGDHLGHLITVRGIATRVSDVKPSVQVNAYSCDRCGHEIFQPVTTQNFTPLVECTSDACSANNAKGQLFLSTRASRFLPFQEIKIQ